jgi:hypothetical protein
MSKYRSIVHTVCPLRIGVAKYQLKKIGYRKEKEEKKKKKKRRRETSQGL